MRTADAIFEEVLDAYDKAESDRIMMQGLDVRDRTVEHIARVEGYREEFREAMQPIYTTRPDFLTELLDDPPPALGAEILQEPRHSPAALAELVEDLKAKLREVPSVAKAMDERKERNPPGVAVPRKQVRCGDCGAWRNATEPRCLVCPGDEPERPDQRGERLSERYTRDDGSSR
jgi:hypothetical protein